MQPQPQLSNPYAAPAARVSDVVEDRDQVLAERSTRLLAAIVDGLIIAGVMAVMFVVAISFAPNDAATRRAWMPGVMVAIYAVAILSIGVINMVLLHRHGQTIAKRMFKIKVLRSDGSRCSLLRIIFLRFVPVTLLGAIPFIGALFSLLDPLLIFRDDYRCLHDHIADTIVVKA